MYNNEQQFGEQTTQPQQQQQFAQPQQHQQFAQPQQQQQFAQPQQHQQFAQPQFQQFRPTPNVNQQQLNKSGIIALSGIAVVALGLLIGTFSVYSAINSSAAASFAFNATGASSTTYLITVFQFIVLAAFIFLAAVLKNTKSKEIAIVLIVFSPIFLFSSILGFLAPNFGVQLSSLISVGGWGTVLTAGVFATQAFK